MFIVTRNFPDLLSLTAILLWLLDALMIAVCVYERLLWVDISNKKGNVLTYTHTTGT